VDTQTVLKPLMAGLTYQPDIGSILDLRRQPTVAPLSKAQRCSYTAGVRMKQAPKTRQLADIELAAERNPTICQ
jgi:hypothetical protein